MLNGISRARPAVVSTGRSGVGGSGVEQRSTGWSAPTAGSSSLGSIPKRHYSMDGELKDVQLTWSSNKSLVPQFQPTLRVGGASDRAHLKEFLSSLDKDTWQARFGPRQTDENIESLADQFISEPMVLCFDGSRLVGLATVYVAKDTPQEGELAMVVHPDSQGKDVGRNLARGAEELAKSRGINVLTGYTSGSSDRGALRLVSEAGYESTRLDAFGVELGWRKQLDGVDKMSEQAPKVSPKDEL